MDEQQNHNDSNVNPSPLVQRYYNARVLGTLSIFFGVMSLITGFVPCVNWLVFVPGLCGIAAGVVGLMQARKMKETATLCYIGIALSILGCLTFFLQNILINHAGNGSQGNKS